MVLLTMMKRHWLKTPKNTNVLVVRRLRINIGTVHDSFTI